MPSQVDSELGWFDRLAREGEHLRLARVFFTLCVAHHEGA
jgi:hypothetical protein